MERRDSTDQREDLLESIERDREEVRVALHDLTDAATHQLDVTDRIRSSPLAWALGAFLVGAWLGDRASSAHAAAPRRPKE